MGQGTSKPIDPLHRVKGQLKKNTETLNRKLTEKNKLITQKEKQLLKLKTDRQNVFNKLEYLKKTNIKTSHTLQQSVTPAKPKTNVKAPHVISGTPKMNVAR